MPEHDAVDECFSRISEQLQALVKQQDELIKYLTGSTREELKAAAGTKTEPTGHTDPKGGHSYDVSLPDPGR